MKLKIFSLYDSGVKAFNVPMFLRSRGEAIRSLQATVNEAGNNLNRWPDQFTLFEMGEFDDESGAISMYATPESLGLASQYKDSPRADTPLEEHIKTLKEVK